MPFLGRAFLSRRLSRQRALTALGAASFGTAVLFAIGAWQGCSIYGPQLLVYDAGPEASAAPACEHIRWPSRPAPSDASPSGGGDTQVDFAPVAAMQAIDVGYGFGMGDAGPNVAFDAGLAPYGWDLDLDCTCRGSPPGPPSCMQAAGTAENCDDDAGRDHIALELFRALGVTAETGSLTANQAMYDGLYGLVVQINGYNGQLDDEQVTVALYASNGIDGVQDGGTPAPKHDGTDKWTVDPRYISNGPTLASAGTDCDDNNPSCVPIYSDNDAYVAGGVLVASLGTVPLTFGSRANIGGALMQLNEVKLVGTLVPASAGTNEGWAITNGSVSGRWETSQLLGNLSTIPDPANVGQYFCGTDPIYDDIKKGICGLQDIAATSGNDNTSAPCDALSMAFGFIAQPARLGPILGIAPAPAGCTTDGGPAWHDTCTPP